MPKSKNKKIEVIIDGQKIQVESGQTVLQVAKEHNIKIPTLCYHPDLKPEASCRLCLVAIKGVNDLQTACSTKLTDGMEIITNSPKIRRARKVNLELIFSEHCEECGDCIWQYNCQIKELALEYKVNITRFTDRKKGWPNYKFGSALEFDSSKCIDCGNCIAACKQQGVCFLETKEKNTFYQVITSQSKKKDCVYCGQCITHCPVGAFEGVGEFEEISKPLKDKNKVVVFQFAPSIRASIGEEFDMPHGSVVTGKLAAAIRALGADKVFDVAVGADFTTIAEADELAERLESGHHLPMFTSCCPAWVKYIEFYRPDLIPNLTTVRSPQLILAGLIKTYWAEKEKVDPKNIVLVSIMPCISKKYEVRRPELKINNLQLIDYVLTTRELAYLFKRNKIDFKNIKPEQPDNPLGLPTGAGVIYGASGGVMESALRTAYYKLTGRQLPKLDLTAVRGMADFKKADIKVKNKSVRVGVVNGLGNACKVLEEIKKNPKAYDYIEVMACPGGCIGGGGQPVPTSEEIRQKRAASLYQVDAKKKIRMANKNPITEKVYQDYFSDKNLYQKINFTKFKKKNKEVNYKF